MGVLDEAIREHLELKRRRGADPGEVAKQESEAFGPARRALEALEEAAAAPSAVEADRPPLRMADQPPVLQEEPPRFHGDPADELPAAEAHHEPVPLSEPPAPHGDPAEALDASQPTQAFDPEDVRAATEAFEVDEAPPETRAATDPVESVEPPPKAAERPPTAVMPVVEPPAPPPPASPAGEAEAEDVLEETPEFLQETPEHERLWFEQRPPRDFDF